MTTTTTTDVSMTTENARSTEIPTDAGNGDDTTLTVDITSTGDEGATSTTTSVVSVDSPPSSTLETAIGAALGGGLAIIVLLTILIVVIVVLKRRVSWKPEEQPHGRSISYKNDACGTGTLNMKTAAM